MATAKKSTSGTMRGRWEFFPGLSEDTAATRAQWAEIIEDCEGGAIAFELEADYLNWHNKGKNK